MSRKANGIYYENKFKAYLESLGHTVVRSAASAGPFDLVTIPNDKIKSMIVVQVKSIRTGKKIVPSFAKDFRNAAVDKQVRKVLAVYNVNGKTSILNLYVPSKDGWKELQWQEREK